MKTQKFLAPLAALAILFTLSSCDWITKNPDNNNTTTAVTTAAEPVTLDPTRPLASMEPIQGGPMLYTFWGTEAYAHHYSDYDGEEYPVYPIGLVDQDGKLASSAVYHHADYIYDQAEQRVIGLAAVKGREITIYELGGQSRALPVEGHRVDIFPGGRYAIIYTAQDAGQGGGYDITDPLEEGIFDLQENKYVIEPKAGQMIQYATGGMALGYQYNTPDGTGDETAQWAFNAADASIVALPLSMGRVQQVFPETGWFGSITNDYEQRVYDKNLEIIPTLTGWSIDYAGFGGGAWCMIYNNNAFPDVTTWVNRKGELSQQRYTQYVQTNDGGKSYFINNDGGVTALLDAGLNEVFALGAGERFARLESPSYNPRTGSAHGGYLHLNADKSIKAAYDLAGKPMQASDAFRCWWSLNDWHPDGAFSYAYAAQNGQWTALDLTQFFPNEQAGHSDGVPYANPIVMCEDFIVIETGVHWYEAGVVYNTYAVDWDGEFVDDCPLAPFFGVLSPYSAGFQGPNYYWIEQEDGKRGYINTKGEWLFVDEG